MRSQNCAELNGALVHVNKYDKSKERFEVALAEDHGAYPRGHSVLARTVCLIDSWVAPGVAVLEKVVDAQSDRKLGKNEASVRVMRVKGFTNAENVSICDIYDNSLDERVVSAHLLIPLIGHDAQTPSLSGSISTASARRSGCVRRSTSAT